MNNQILHTIQRLQERNINLDINKLIEIAKKYNDDTAIVVKKLSSNLNIRGGDYYNRQESNGDLIVLIVRNKEPHTIMFRRSTQPKDTKALNVKKFLFDIIQ